MSTLLKAGTSDLTPVFAAFAKYHAVTVVACRPRSGNRQGAAEKNNHAAAQCCWRNLPDELTLGQAQASVEAFAKRQDDRRRAGAAGSTTAAAMFATEGLRPLPPTVFPVIVTATERELQKIAAAVVRDRRPLRGKDAIALRDGKVANRYKMAKHFTIGIGNTSFRFTRNQDQIAAEAALDGIYVLRTSVSDDVLSATQVVSSYKGLAGVERAFRDFNIDLDIRPIRHHTEGRVRAHDFPRMLSYYVTFHMESALTPMLFKDDDKETAQQARTSPVAPATRSSSARARMTTKGTAERLPVHSFKSLLAELATICANRIQPTDARLPALVMITTPTPVQRRAFELLGISHRLGYP